MGDERNVNETGINEDTRSEHVLFVSHPGMGSSVEEYWKEIEVLGTSPLLPFSSKSTLGRLSRCPFYLDSSVHEVEKIKCPSLIPISHST